MTDTQPNPASPAPDDPTEVIATALSRLRGRRRGPRGGADGAFPEGAIGAHHGHHQHRAHHGHGAPNGAPHATGDPRADGDPRLERGFGGPPAIVRMLEALGQADSPLGVSAIAEVIGVDQPRASRLVQQGVARELIAREADPDDARRTRIALTARGREFTQGVRTTRREQLSTALAEFTEHERDDLARLLTKLAHAWPR